MTAASAPALASGLVADELAATAALRAERTAHREDPITGVSEFPLIGEKPLQRKAAPAAADRPGGPAPACVVRPPSRP